MQAEHHDRAANYLDGIGDQHDLALGHGVREGPHKGRQHHIGQHEEQLQQRGHPLRGMQFGEKGDGGDE
ncbi:hypothetical protein D3C87_1334450 [compost metagenome]